MRHVKHARTVTCPDTGRVYPIPAGGAGDDGGDPPPDGDDPTAGDDEPLGEPGKKALEAERAARKEAEKKARRADELEAELEKFREQQMSEQEKAIAAARKEAADEARTEALSTANARLFKAEVRAAAAGKVADTELLNDPDVALRLLGFDEVPVTEDGDVDAEAISAALDELVERKPYLAVSATRPAGDVDQGTRGGGQDVTTTMNDLLRAARS